MEADTDRDERRLERTRHEPRLGAGEQRLPVSGPDHVDASVGEDHPDIGRIRLRPLVSPEALDERREL